MSLIGALAKREFLDHKGAMLWTQLAVGALLVIAIIWGAASVPLFNPQFRQADVDNGAIFQINHQIAYPVNETGDILDDGFVSPGRILQQLNNMAVKDRTKGAHALGSGLFVGAAILPLLLAMLMVPFILLASLYDERQDRSILFWKSLPVSDAQVVLAKLFFAASLTFGIAFAVGISVHIVALASVTIIGSGYDISGLSSIWHIPTLLNTWATWAMMVIQYIITVLPVYAWFLLVSAAAPRSPFLFAFMIPVAVIMFEGLWNHSSYLAKYFFGRLSGGPIMLNIIGMSDHADTLELGNILFAAQKSVLFGFTRIDIWVGILVAAALIYVAIEIRRRKTL
jgi:ABC-2 type transport system permease protein